MAGMEWYELPSPQQPPLVCSQNPHPVYLLKTKKLNVSCCDCCLLGAIDDSMLSMLFWGFLGLSVMGMFSQGYGLRPFTVALILRSIYHFGIGPTLILLGTLNVSLT